MAAPRGIIPPRVPGTTPPKRVGSCQVIIQLNLESVFELVEDSVVVVIVIVMVIATIVVVVELASQIVAIVSLVPVRQAVVIVVRICLVIETIVVVIVPVTAGCTVEFVNI